MFTTRRAPPYPHPNPMMFGNIYFTLKYEKKKRIALELYIKNQKKNLLKQGSLMRHFLKGHYVPQKISNHLREIIQRKYGSFMKRNFMKNKNPLSIPAKRLCYYKGRKTGFLRICFVFFDSSVVCQKDNGVSYLRYSRIENVNHVFYNSPNWSSTMKIK